MLICLDVGGIGRITTQFLSKMCDKVDLVEPAKTQVKQANKDVADLKVKSVPFTILVCMTSLLSKANIR
jgi:hypothetical protein